jgi:hypothetical protein
MIHHSHAQHPFAESTGSRDNSGRRLELDELERLVEVLKDRSEHERVRVHVLKLLRNRDGLVAASDCPRVAQAISDVLADTSTPDLRLEAALGLGAFTQIDGVLATLGNLVLAGEESIDLRYAAFTSIERAGPTPESISLMRVIAGDETLGSSARGVLSAWHVE